MPRTTSSVGSLPSTKLKEVLPPSSVVYDMAGSNNFISGDSSVVKIALEATIGVFTSSSTCGAIATYTF